LLKGADIPKITDVVFDNAIGNIGNGKEVIQSPLTYSKQPGDIATCIVSGISGIAAAWPRSLMM